MTRSIFFHFLLFTATSFYSFSPLVIIYPKNPIIRPVITAKSIEYNQLSMPNDKVAAKIELNTMTIISLFIIIYHPFPYF